MKRWLVAPILGFVGLLLTLGGVASCAVRMPGKTFTGPLAPLTSLEMERAATLERHIDVLAVQIGERNVHYQPAALADAEAYIIEELVSYGYTVERETYDADGVEVANVIAVLPGSAETVVVGAHYDSAPGTPGADDNASGVAALLVLADALEAEKPKRTIRLVAFTNEEPPWFHGEDMGSRHHARNSRERGDDIVAMLSLETLGYYRDEPGTQHYPSPLNLLYPDTGNFVGFVGNVASRSLVRRSIRTFRDEASFPSQGGAVPASIEGVGWSDHRSFWEQGYRAVMVTDTAPNRNPHYHQETDLPGELDVERLSRVVGGLRAVVLDLANGDAL